MMEIEKELKNKENKEQAKNLARFFKTGKGEYGEGDVFLGLKVPETRKISKKYINLDFKSLQILLNSKIHEYRMAALLILVLKYNEANEDEREKIYNFYLKNTKNINNWDLVDLTAPNIVGDYLLKKDKKILYSLAKSDNLWEKRIAVLATFTFIREKDFKDSLRMAKMLLKDKHDLIHKAVGWMLREVGKRDKKAEIDFLNENYMNMPRTMLRYAIEKFPQKQRLEFLVKP